MWPAITLFGIIIDYPSLVLVTWSAMFAVINFELRVPVSEMYQLENVIKETFFC